MKKNTGDFTNGVLSLVDWTIPRKELRKYERCGSDGEPSAHF